jgi:hypothetical protein
MAYWQSLASILAEEHVREIDKIMMAMLEPLGIVKGEPFAPDARQALVVCPLVVCPLVAPSALRRHPEDALAGRCYGFATAYIRHSPGTPFNSWAP